MKFDHSSRLLFGALAASLLLHLLAVFGWGWAPRLLPAVPQPAMQVVVAGPVPSVASADVARQPVRTEPKLASTPATLPTESRTKPVVTPALATERNFSEPASVLPASLTEPAGSKAGEGVAQAAPAAAVADAVAQGGGVSADGLRQYRIELAGAARRFRSYPALARSRGWEGVAEVTVVVSTGVPGPALQLAKSSGHAVLDEQAMDMLSRAAASTPLPESLRGKSFSVPMPIRFSLQD